MIYNATELDEMPGVESYTKEPTWVDTFKASTKNFTSVSLSTSELSYFTDERHKNMEEWKKKDPANKSTYDRYGNIPKGVQDKLEALYEDGNIDAIKNWNQASFGGLSTGEEFLKFKELAGIHGFKDYSEFNQDAKDKSLKDFQESQEVLSNSDSLSAEMLGTMFGALHDPITLATIPLGGWTAGRGVMMNAARSFGQEAMIEAGAQAVIAPMAYSYKKEIGLKTSIKTEAYNAVMSIGAAGLVRGTGSAMFDLSAKGIKALKVKNPSLGEAYESMAKTQPTQDMKTHIDNMNKVEFSGEPLTEIKTPNEKGVELNNAKVISEVDEDILAIKDKMLTIEEAKAAQRAKKKPLSPRAEAIQEASVVPIGGSEEEAAEAVKRMFKKDKSQEAKIKAYSKEDIVELERMDKEELLRSKPKGFTDEEWIEANELFGDVGEMRIVVDKDIEGNIKTRSYKEINAEYDENDIMFKRIQDCILGVA
jgi:hypothetical protein